MSGEHTPAELIARLNRKADIWEAAFKGRPAYRDPELIEVLRGAAVLLTETTAERVSLQERVRILEEACDGYIAEAAEARAVHWESIAGSTEKSLADAEARVRQLLADLDASIVNIRSIEAKTVERCAEVADGETMDRKAVASAIRALIAQADASHAE